MQMGDEKRAAYGTKEWTEYVEFRLRNGLSVEEDFTLAMLEMEVPFSKLGFDSFEEFLRNRIPDLNSLLKDPEIRKERFLVPVESVGNLKVGSRVVWLSRDSTTFKGTIKWLGSVERIMCAGIFCDEKVGSPFPVMWRGRRLFYTPSGHSLILRVNELILKSEYSLRRTSSLSRALTKLMRKVSIVERPRREDPSAGDTLDSNPSKFQHFDVIYPYSVETGPNGLKVNDAVVWVSEAGSYTGTIKWLGHLNCGSGVTVGIDFEQDIGNCSGNYEGHQLFHCSSKHGKFLCIECVQRSIAVRSPSEVIDSGSTIKHLSQDLRLYWRLNQHHQRDFQIGDSILYRRDPNSYLTGTVEWLGIKDGAQIAGIRLDASLRPPEPVLQTEPLPFDCPQGFGCLTLVENLVLYNAVIQRAKSCDESASSSSSSLHISSLGTSLDTLLECPTGNIPRPHFSQKNQLEPCVSPERLKFLIGYKRGIQGRGSSRHLDSLLFAIFSCSDKFDKVLLGVQSTDPLPIKIFKELLRTEVVNRLRRKFYCPASNVQAVAKVYSRNQEPYFPGKSDEVLEALLYHVNPNENDGFLSYSNDSSSYLHRIMASSCNLSEPVVTIQRLLETDMKMQNLKFKDEPAPVLVIVLPEKNKELVSPTIVVPNSTLELNRLMSGEFHCPLSSEPCVLCGEITNGAIECLDCDSLSPMPGSTSANMFCIDCFEAFHQYRARRSHRKNLNVGDKDLVFELQSIICCRENKSIAFVKCGTGTSGEWMVHDSMPDGSSSQVQHVFSLTDCLSSMENSPAAVLKDWNSFIPEIKIILSFAHVCIYSASVKNDE